MHTWVQDWLSHLLSCVSQILASFQFFFSSMALIWTKLSQPFFRLTFFPTIFHHFSVSEELHFRKKTAGGRGPPRGGGNGGMPTLVLGAWAIGGFFAKNGPVWSHVNQLQGFARVELGIFEHFELWFSASFSLVCWTSQFVQIHQPMEKSIPRYDDAVWFIGRFGDAQVVNDLVLTKRPDLLIIEASQRLLSAATGSWLCLT